MKDRIMRRVSKCTSCNSSEIDISHHHDLGVIMCLCRVCGNRWGQ